MILAYTRAHSIHSCQWICHLVNHTIASYKWLVVMMITPELPNELFLRSIVDGAKDDCIMNKGLTISGQEVDDTVADFVSLFGAQECWIQLCEEGSNGNGPSDVMIRIMLEEIASCAGADMDSIDPCLFDQMMDLLFSGANDEGFGDDSIDRVRRRLQDTFDNNTNNNDDQVMEPPPCPEEPNDTEVYFIVSLLMAGAEEQCLELGETLQPGATSLASTELVKLFSAQHCWGVPDNGCNHDNKDHHEDDGAHSAYLDFIKEETTWMLGQCADFEEMSCVFSRSIEVIHGMHHHHHNTTHNAIHELAQHEISHMCTAPVDHEFDMYQIAAHASEHCFQVGAFVHADHYQQAVDDIHNLMTMPEFWEDLCHPETKDAILDEWMHTCAMTDIKFHDDDSLDKDMLHCMTTEYIVPSIEEGGNWACTLSHDHQSCNRMALKDAYIHCGGEVIDIATPSPTPPMQLSMSFAYTENDYDWAQYEPEDSFHQFETEMSFSYAFDDGFSMPYGDDDWHVPPPSPPHHHEDEEMKLYINEVCNLISNLSSNTAQYCLESVCDGLWLDDVVVNDNHQHGDNDDDWKYSVSPTPQPSSVEFVLVQTSSPTSTPTKSPVTTQPSAKPTPKPTNQPSPSPTALVFGEVEVAFEVSVKLEGLNMTDIDITKLDEVVDILESVFGDLLPEGAIVRILSVGGLSVARRSLRWLQDSASSGGDNPHRNL